MSEKYNVINKLHKIISFKMHVTTFSNKMAKPLVELWLFASKNNNMIV